MPFVAIPLKRTLPLDFAPAFTTHIEKHHQEDPALYTSQIAAMNKVRMDCCGSIGDMDGRDISYRYYGQLELLDGRFDICESGVKVLFTWYDAFTQEETSQHALPYEKACVLYNIAATLSTIASTADLSTPAGLKLSYNYFQSAAGMFQFINDNFLHPPSTDLSKGNPTSSLLIPDSVKVLVNLCLAQSQESFILNALTSKPHLLSKLHAHVASLYTETHQDMINPALSKQFTSSWVAYAKLKSNQHTLTAGLQKSIALESEAKYGEALGYIQSAETLSKETINLSLTFLKKHASFPSTSTTKLAPILTEQMQALITRIGDVSKKMTRDNDMIYNAYLVTPAVFEKTCVVSLKLFEDLLSDKNDVQRIVGRDIFTGLVPMRVHEAHSIYSEDVAKIGRRVKEVCEGGDAVCEGCLRSLEVTGVVGVVKGEWGVPGDVLDACESVRMERGGVEKRRGEMESVRARCVEGVGRCRALIEADVDEDDTLRNKYANVKVETAFQLTISYQQDLKKFEGMLADAKGTDVSVDAAFMKRLDVLMLPTSKFQGVVKSLGETECLLDVDTDAGVEVFLSKISGLLSSLRTTKTERAAILAELLKKTEDVTQNLVTFHGQKELLFQKELLKFQPLQTRITESLAKQTALLQTLTELVTKLKTTATYKLQSAQEVTREGFYEDVRTVYGDYLKTLASIQDGTAFYNGLLALIENCEAGLKSYREKMSGRRKEIEARRLKEQGVNGLESMRAQLQRLGMNSQSNSSHQNEGGYDRPAPLPPMQTGSMSNSPQYGAQSTGNAMGGGSVMHQQYIDMQNRQAGYSLKNTQHSTQPQNYQNQSIYSQPAQLLQLNNQLYQTNQGQMNMNQNTNLNQNYLAAQNTGYQQSPYYAQAPNINTPNNINQQNGQYNSQSNSGQRLNNNSGQQGANQGMNQGHLNNLNSQGQAQNRNNLMD